MTVKYQISEKRLKLNTIYDLISEGKQIELSQESTQKVEKCYQYLQDKLNNSDKPFYGINTGFGSLCNIKVSNENLQQLQENLVKSHACGMGEEIAKPIVKLMLFLKIQSLSYGHSGCQLATINRLIDFYNHDVYPVIYSLGSLGASGDLSPLAHLALPLIAEGEVDFQGERMSGKALLEKMNWDKINLSPKEGLALLNGTQFMSAHGVFGLFKAKKLSYLADLHASISLEAYNGNSSPFDPLVHFVRKQEGQILTASRVNEFLEGSELINLPNKAVQDPYSFRCVPQVHGATKDTIKHVEKVFENEINAVTDNPLIFPEDDKIISGGNFHGQPLALAFDSLSIAIAELGSISERRVYRLIAGERGLPMFLVANPGLNSGFMIPQYTAASIVSQNKQLATPSSIDSISSSNEQEDHVSMGANGATKCIQILDNVERVLSIELFNASQALSFRAPHKSSDFIEMYLEQFRAIVPFVKEDVYMHEQLINAKDFIQNTEIDYNIL